MCRITGWIAGCGQIFGDTGGGCQVEKSPSFTAASCLKSECEIESCVETFCSSGLRQYNFTFCFNIPAVKQIICNDRGCVSPIFVQIHTSNCVFVS